MINERLNEQAAEAEIMKQTAKRQTEYVQKTLILRKTI